MFVPGFDPTAPEEAPARDRRPVTFDLRLLESFLVLADELHFGRAAQRLGFAQPARSRQVRRLETQVGVPLFTRNAHGVALSAAGLAFRGPAGAALTSALDAAADAVRAAQGVTGHLTVAIGQGVLVLVGDLLRSFAEVHAKVDLEIVSITDATGLEAVRSGGVSAAVVWSDASPPRGFETSATAVLDVPHPRHAPPRGSRRHHDRGTPGRGSCHVPPPRRSGAV